MKHKGFFGLGKLRARLTFNDGFAEKPLYSIKAVTTEKNKGHDMIQLIMNNFNITHQEIFREEQKLHETMRSEVPLMKYHQNTNDPFTRDEKGNIVSPFRSTRKLT